MQLFKKICVAFSMFLFIGCFSGDEPTKGLDSEIREGLGGIEFGGIFRYNEESYFRDLFPLNITETIAHRLSTNMYEGLVGLSQDELKIVPLLAESWDISPDGLNYTFKLRQGVRFHNNPCFPEEKGKEMTAKDVKFSFDLLCTSIPKNEGFWIMKDKVLGATSHYEATKKGAAPEGGVEGIQVIDDYTVKIVLEKPFPDFMRLLVTPFTYIFPEEAYKQYKAEGLRKNVVGTGPFILTSLIEGEKVLMRKNPNYWGKDVHGNKLPYLDGVRVSFIKEQKSALLEFVNEKLDMIYRPALEMTDQILNADRTALTPAYEQFQLQIQDVLSYQYYGFQHKTKPFNNKKVREAFCYAIDRQKVVDFALKGLGKPAFNGIIPPAFKGITGYQTDAVKGFNYDPEKARKLLKEAGFPNGKGLPEITLQINSGGGRNGQIAEAIQKQIEESLNINVKILQLQFPQHLETTETGKTHFWRAGWVADYTSPENFLRLYYGASVPKKLATKSYLNTVRYQSEAYDGYFEKSLETMDVAARQALYKQAEEQLIKDAAVMPIFFSKDVRLLQGDVRNLPQNAMEYRHFREVYFSRKNEI